MIIDVIDIYYFNFFDFGLINDWKLQIKMWQMSYVMNDNILLLELW